MAYTVEPTGHDPRGELVRPFAITRGRTQPRRPIAIEALLGTTGRGVLEAASGSRHKQAIASLCEQRALSLAEIAAYSRLPLGVCRVLVADMVSDGLLALHDPMGEAPEEAHIELLERVLVGLRRL